MAASTAAQPMSKSARKKAAKAIERTDSPALSTVSLAVSADKTDDGFESPYIKELQKYVSHQVVNVVSHGADLTRFQEHSKCKQEDCKAIGSSHAALPFVLITTYS